MVLRLLASRSRRPKRDSLQRTHEREFTVHDSRLKLREPAPYTNRTLTNRAQYGIISVQPTGYRSGIQSRDRGNPVPFFASPRKKKGKRIGSASGPPAGLASPARPGDGLPGPESTPPGRPACPLPWLLRSKGSDQRGVRSPSGMLRTARKCPLQEPRGGELNKPPSRPPSGEAQPLGSRSGSNETAALIGAERRPARPESGPPSKGRKRRPPVKGTKSDAAPTAADLN